MSIFVMKEFEVCKQKGPPLLYTGYQRWYWN